MKIHEYQAKELLAAYGITVPEGKVARTAEEAYEISSSMCPCVIKAQAHTGGRGKAGGVKLAKSPEEARDIAAKMLGMTLVTKQTGPEGRPVSSVLVAAAVEVEKEYYLSLTTDSVNAGLVIVVSAAGGTEIEETAAKNPEAIVQIPVSVTEGFKTYEGIRAAEVLGLDDLMQKQLILMLGAMTRLYLEKDCSLIEINPLVKTTDNRLLCLDAKINFDDNAIFRHPDVLELRDVSQEDAKEYKASCPDLN